MDKNVLRVIALALAVVGFAGCRPGMSTNTSQSSTTAPTANSNQTASNNGANASTLAATNAFLATLDAEKRAKVMLPLDAEHRVKWSNFPVGIYPRNGVRWGDLTQPQRDAEMALLATVLSGPG